ncbi:hypothetical protein C8F01DRAFT_992854 [Mycena amicta]|nr:hypothetical protein C8F01DRAFT_992854 [Mycena amicta]
MVMVTRAQSLLIVVGDLNRLGLDLPWRAFLNYMSINNINNRWTGPDPKLELAGNVYADQVRSSTALDMNVFIRWMEVLTVAGAKDVNVEFKC